MRPHTVPPTRLALGVLSVGLVFFGVAAFEAVAALVGWTPGPQLMPTSDLALGTVAAVGGAVVGAFVMLTWNGGL